MNTDVEISLRESVVLYDVIGDGIETQPNEGYIDSAACIETTPNEVYGIRTDL